MKKNIGIKRTVSMGTENISDIERVAMLPTKITINIEEFNDFVSSNRNMEIQFVSQNKQEIMIQVEKIINAWIALKTVYR